MRQGMLFICLAVCALPAIVGCEDDDRDPAQAEPVPVTFTMEHPVISNDITVHGLWSDGGTAVIANPYPMRSGGVNVTERGETHSFDFTSITYHAQEGPRAFTVVVDGRWTCSYRNPHVQNN